ncbi:Glyoxalase/bleomycin resistance protein/dioxygenase [hydrothermal vent metagenome]|uniref:Glyoxalase/bleomycin resistance protein/dioxygenase n=1 Tax=hydrothermal vent metagenome TaxID=652676 RepID=A0A3B0XVB6_9ZZZZ
MGVLSIHHVSLIIADTEQALGFYHGILGLKVCDNRPDLGFPGAWLIIGEQQIHLLEVPNPDSVDNRPEYGGRDRHLAVTVENLSEFEQKLIVNDVAFSKSSSGRAALFCRDPDGNGVELIEKAGD